MKLRLKNLTIARQIHHHPKLEKAMKQGIQSLNKYQQNHLWGTAILYKYRIHILKGGMLNPQADARELYTIKP